MESEFIILQEKAAQGVLCSICPEPGACCKLFDTSAVQWDDATPDEVDAYMANQFNPVPWHAVMPGAEKYTVSDPANEDFGRTYSHWLFTCPKLSPDGRCSIYETRPNSCRKFTPASASICVFHREEA